MQLVDSRSDIPFLGCSSFSRPLISSRDAILQRASWFPPVMASLGTSISQYGLAPEPRTLDARRKVYSRGCLPYPLVTHCAEQE